VRDHRDQAVGLAWRLLGGDRAAAEDVAQDAFLRAYRGLDRFREESKLSTWFFRILLREAQRHLRWRAVRERFGGVPECGAPGGPDGDWPAAEGGPVPDPALRRRIGRALLRLSRGQREAFVMIHLEGFTVMETAEVLGRSPGTVKTHLHRALKALRSELEGLMAEPEPRAEGEKDHDAIRV
jgi:RNA polymerase sigma-70 factor (ECF subfamily)